MNEDKFYIKDLQPIRNIFLNSDKEDVYKYIYSLQQENQQLKEQRYKAIEYIKSYKTDYSPYELSDYNVRQILEILKGEDNNE